MGERLRDRFGAGTVFVPLDTVTEPGLVLVAVGRMAGGDLGRAGSPLEALAETFGDGAWLLILDNLEQVVQVARDLGELLARCPGVVIVATSRTVLGLRAEREYPVPPLAAGPAIAPVAEVAAWPAVALFVDRARAVRPGFALTEANAAAVAEICRRLEGLPLAIELAAARTRLLEPAALLDRLAASLDALGAGAVDLPERQRTLRATVGWSVGLLDDAERSLLEVAAVFTDGWTIQAAAQVADLEESRALELSEALARHSLVYLDSTQLGPRTRMLETVHEFVAERLAARPDAAGIGRRHAGFYRALGILAVLRGRLDEARALLDDALDLGLAARSTPFETLCLAAYARLALAEGDSERAARLKGAAEGPAPAGRPAGLAGSATARRRTGNPDPPEAERHPVRPGVLRRLRTHPTAGGRHRPGPARHRPPEVLSRHAHSAEPAAWRQVRNGPALRSRPSPPGQARHGRPGGARTRQ